MTGVRLTPLMGMILVGLLALNGLALAAYAVGWDRVIAAVGSPLLTSARVRAGGWQPPALDANGSLRVKPFEAFAQTVARPLFSRTRRPYEVLAAQQPQKAAVAVAAQALLAEPVVVLSAIAIRGERREALVSTRSNPQGHWFSDGEAIDGWAITGMTADTLTLSAESRTITVKLYDQPGLSVRGPAPVLSRQ